MYTHCISGHNKPASLQNTVAVCTKHLCIGNFAHILWTLANPETMHEKTTNADRDGMADNKLNQFIARTRHVAVTVRTDLVDKNFKCIFEGFLKKRVARELFVHKRSIFVVQREQLPHKRRIRATINSARASWVSKSLRVCAFCHKTTNIKFFYRHLESFVSFAFASRSLTTANPISWICSFTILAMGGSPSSRRRNSWNIRARSPSFSFWSSTRHPLPSLLSNVSSCVANNSAIFYVYMKKLKRHFSIQYWHGGRVKPHTLPLTSLAHIEKLLLSALMQIFVHAIRLLV